MKITKPIALSVLALSTVAAWADYFTMGRDEIAIPSPNGFARVTADMPTLQEFCLEFAAQDDRNRTLASYIPESEVPSALEGEVVSLDRYCLVKVSRGTEAMVISPSEFVEFRTKMRSQFSQIMDKVRSALPDYYKGASDVVSKAVDEDMIMELGSMVPLEVHRETDESISFSMFMRNDISAGEESVSYILTCTSTILNVAGKVISLNVYGLKDELDWTRDVALAWEQSILERVADDRPAQRTDYFRQPESVSDSRTQDDYLLSGLPDSVLLGFAIAAFIVLLILFRGSRT